MKRTLVSLFCLALTGCAVGGGADNSGVVGAIYPAAQALPEVSEKVWKEADLDCEGQVSHGSSFALADKEAGLIAVFDKRGIVVCVDTVEDVEDELLDTGRAGEADRLADSYAAAVESGPGPYAGDPHPVPDVRAQQGPGPYAGDPHPVPDVQGAEGR